MRLAFFFAVVDVGVADFLELDLDAVFSGGGGARGVEEEGPGVGQSAGDWNTESDRNKRSSYVFKRFVEQQTT